MQSSSDSSLWRSLAGAFGDGLAFGVGMKLMQSAGRARYTPPQLSAPPSSDPGRSSDGNELHFQHTARAATGSNTIDRKVFEAIVNALEVRLNEHSAQVERRLTDQDAKISHMVGLNREFSEAVEQMVGERVASQVAKRVAELELHLPAAIRTVLEPLERRLRDEVDQRDREIADLRHRLADTDTNMQELILGIGRICRQAADRVAAPATSGVTDAAPTAPVFEAKVACEAGGEPVSGEPETPAVESAEDSRDAGLSQGKNTATIWRVPLLR